MTGPIGQWKRVVMTIPAEGDKPPLGIPGHCDIVLPNGTTYRAEGCNIAIRTVPRLVKGEVERTTTVTFMPRGDWRVVTEGAD